MPRKILFYTHAFGGGGAETVFARLAAAFSQAGDDVTFAADYSGPTPVHDTPRLRRVLLGESHAGATRQLARLLARERYDASFSALGAQNIKHLAAAMAAGRRHQCVLGFHGFAEAEPKRLSQLAFRSARLTTRLAARTICVSDVLRSNLCARWGASPPRTVRIYNPLPPLGAGAPSQTHPEKPPIVLAVGRLAPIKRFDDLIRAMALVTPRESRLIIVGDGPEREALQGLIRATGLEDRVELVGHVAEPAPYYRRAACLAISSQSESFALTAAEALAYGLPVVATACGGPNEVLAEGRFGRLVAIGDVPALAAALSQALAEPGDPGPRRQRAETFSLEAIHRAYAELIDSLP